jgi:hypothetical protein
VKDKELDQLFKSKLGSAQAQPFSAANWAAMESVLNADAKAPVIAFWRQAAIIIGFAGLVGIGLLWQPISNKNPQSVQPVVNTTNPQLEQGNTVTKAPESTPEKVNQFDEPAQEKPKENTPKSQINAPAPINSNPPLLATADDSRDANANSVDKIGAISRESATFIAPISPSAFTELGLPAETTSLNKLKPLTPLETTQAIIPVDISVLARYQKRQEFYLTGGPLVNSSYGSQNGTGFNAGLGYRYRLNSKLALTAEAIYNQTGDMGLLIETDSVFFGFGRTEVNTQRHYKNVGSLRFPVAFEYNLSPAHSLSAGTYVESVVNVSMDMTRKTETFKGDVDTRKHSNNQQRPEFNNFNYGLQMAYFYQVYPQLSIGLRVNYGLSDLTNNQHQHFQQNHRLLQTDLTLRYRLF